MSRPQGAAFSIGKPGRHNEDAYALLARPDGTAVYALADGVGGSSSGQLSAQVAIDAIKEWAASSEADVSLAFSRADRMLKERVSAEPDQYRSLATTLTVLMIRGLKGTFAHVGDCRAYLLRGAGLRTLTTDQTEVRKLVELGVLSKARAKDYKRSHVLLSALGSSAPYELQIGEFDLQHGDRLLLCSDGFYNAVPKKEVVAVSSGVEFVDELMSKLRDLTQRSHPVDDATVIVLGIEDGDEP
jgi:protein phosphatase